MSLITCINSQFVQDLFENDTFRQRLKLFMSTQSSERYECTDEKTMRQINLVSQELSGMIIEAMSKESQKRFDLVAQQITKISSEIANLKNVVFGCNEKIDLETTYYNKSRLQLSSILDQDMGYDMSEIKSSLVEIQQRFNEWFGGKISSEQFSTADSLSESKLSQFVSKKCIQQIQLSERKTFKRFQTTEIVTERRIEQVWKTMNNVLQMLNEGHNKKNERVDPSQIDLMKQPTPSQPLLIRQSSLQNLKIKSFFNFGHK